MVINVYKVFFILLLLFEINLLAIDKNEVLDDTRLRGVFEEKINKLSKEKQFPDISLLYDQLERKSCSANLLKVNTKEILLKNVYSKARPSVLMIGRGYWSKSKKKWQTSIACGFIIDKKGIAVTNYHVMEPARGSVMAAMTMDNKVYPIIEVIAADKVKDIAIIRLKGEGFTPLPISRENEVGSKIALISHPAGRFYTLSTGVITRHYIDTDKGQKAHRFAVSADFAKGSSGAPILDYKGNVVGMVSSTRSVYYNQANGVDQNLQMVIKNCVPSQSILDLVKDSKK